MEDPLVSVLIRTCQRPEVLRTALNSLRVQTYPKIQIVIVEDGENKTERMLAEEYSDLNYVYEATGTKVGRCIAGNRALELAEGTYLNFLDDDDCFLPNHIELLARMLAGSKEKAAYSIAEEHQIIVASRQPYRFKTKRKTVRFRQPFNRLLLYTFNYLPIQSVMFHRELFEQMGGFDEQLDTLEDWDLWVRYSTHTDFLYADQITSCYYTPYGRREKQERSDGLKDYLEPIHEKFKAYGLTLSVEDINREMAYVIRDYKDRGLIRYLRIFFRVVFLGER